ncbi:MAG: HEAT repeat domain-containing protein, partial [Chloroflexota bacterium]
HTKDIAAQSIPFMPDWPEFGTIYNAHTLSVAETLSGGSNLVLLGHSGSGKTVALADLASKAARRELQDPDLHNRIPILIHASNLNLTSEDDQDSQNAIDILTKAAFHHSSARSQTQLHNFLSTTFKTDNALLLVDGLDELPTPLFVKTVNFIEQVMSQYPDTRAVVAAAPNQLGRLPALGFVPMTMALWSGTQQVQFAQNWGNKWANYIDTTLISQEDQYLSIDPLLLNGWIINQEVIKSPLSFVLQIWSVYAGDVRGRTNIDTIEAYLRRISLNIPQAIETLNQLALKSITLMQPTFTEKDAKKWLSEVISDSELIKNDSVTTEDESTLMSSYNTKILPDLIRNGILIVRADKQLSFVHPEFIAYLAGQTFATVENDEIFEQSYWPLQQLTLHYLASQRNIYEKVTHYQSQLFNQDPLVTGQLLAGRWLRDIPLIAPWRKHILQKLIRIIQDEKHPMGIRTGALSALITTKDPNMSLVYQHLVKSEKTSIRHLAALGMGTLQDINNLSSLVHLLQDYPEVSRAACLALVRIGTQPALEAVANALMGGHEDVRKAAAEAFANHPSAGHATLQEAVAHDDLLVRRAAIYGLQRIHEEWAFELLEITQVQDNQWVVKNAAAQAVEELGQSNPRIPEPLLSLSDNPWLISFAAERGLGISPGKPAQDMLLRALDEGTTTEQIAAMQQLQRRGTIDIFPSIYNLLYGNSSELNDSAYLTLWLLTASGNKLPHPKQFNFE